MSRNTRTALSLLVTGLLLCALWACSSGDSAPAPSDGDTDTEAATDGDADRDGESEAEAEAEACMTFADVPQDTPSTTQKKFALSMFHFNIQYVPGGLEVVNDGETETVCGDSCVGWTDAKLNSWIVTQSFEPVLDLYLAHSTWRGTFEMQALMLEWIGEHHPKVLAKLQKATQEGRIELVSFHYSAQFFLAFPREDLERSVAKVKAIFDKYCVPLSGVVFNQEGQAGEGKHLFMSTHGYSISVWPKNLFSYYRGDEARWPLYTNHGVDVIVGPGEVDASSGIDVTWTFFDDGELLSTPLDPYFAPFQNAKLEKVKEYETKLTGLETSGYKITSITDYVAHLKAQNIAAKPLPQILDGTWQPQSQPLGRWFGMRSQAPYNNLERDNEVRSFNYRVHQALKGAEALAAYAATQNKADGAWRATLDEGWRQLFLAEVSDATGITPWIGEFIYGQTANAAGWKAAQDVTTAALKALATPYATVDLADGKVTPLAELPVAEAPEKLDTPPLAVTLDAPSRTSGMTWYKWGGATEGYELRVDFGAAADVTGKDAPNCKVTLTLPRTESVFAYSPGLMEDEILEIPQSAIVPRAATETNHDVYLPLPNGVFGLGNNWWVIKDCTKVHLAIVVPSDAADMTLRFVDETANPEKGASWRFLFVKGDKAAALAAAKRINTEPVLTLSQTAEAR